ncbi:hypothetical protein GCM10022243_29040 [Saccharothrix violaceirubra]|uniref:Antitoxin n=1 Tax=Saccharothrix violaceirubra TaxID=413306 RepID=A0A7W7WZ67_9PSEU|nr:type II toxin-antitoxin system prevent-host-death family antitoxin [Saccharothrix violaceirubra]MBB4969170.1 prevent-host-death family protein [Saccharothrix violaceirubra]
METELGLDLAKVKTYTMRELNQNTARVLEEVNDSCRPAAVTKHGRFIALITPLRDLEIEQLVLSRGALGDELDRRAGDSTSDDLSPVEVARRFSDRRPG